MTRTEREQQRRHREIETAEIREAIAGSAITGTISRKLGDELIDASREAVAAWYERKNSIDRMGRAIANLERLVGRASSDEPDPVDKWAVQREYVEKIRKEPR